MKDFEQPAYEPLEFGTYLQGFEVSVLQPNDFLNLETESGSRYVFKVVANDEDGVFIEYYSGPGELENSRGKLLDDRIELGEILDYDKGNTSELAGIILTHGEPYRYPTYLLEYEPYLEVLDARQLKPGDHIYMAAEDGFTYIVEVLENDGKKPKIKFVAGRNGSFEMEGKIRILDFKLGMSFRSSVEITAPIKLMFVLPELDLNMLDVLDEDYYPPELEYDKELKKVYIAQVQPGDFITIKTINSTYVLWVEDASDYRMKFTIVGGGNDRITEEGLFLENRIRARSRFKYSDGEATVTSTPVEWVKVSKVHEEAEYNIKKMRADLDAQQHAVMNHPGMHTSPGMWVGVQGSGLHKQDIVGKLGLNLNTLSVDSLIAAWERWDAENNPVRRGPLMPSAQEEAARDYNAIKKEYQALLEKLEATRNIWGD